MVMMIGDNLREKSQICATSTFFARALDFLFDEISGENDKKKEIEKKRKEKKGKEERYRPCRYRSDEYTAVVPTRGLVDVTPMHSF